MERGVAVVWSLVNTTATFRISLDDNSTTDLSSRAVGLDVPLLYERSDWKCDQTLAGKTLAYDTEEIR
jgi:hypothetical protein